MLRYLVNAWRRTPPEHKWLMWMFVVLVLLFVISGWMGGGG